MSCFRGVAKHPLTGKDEYAEFLDDYFGRHEYGVRFADGSVFREQEVESRRDDVDGSLSPGHGAEFDKPLS